MDKIQLITASVISGVSLVIVVARHIWSAVIVLDQATLLLLALAALPWLTLFFKKFKIPGVAEAETREKVQGTTEKPLPPPSDTTENAITSGISSDTKKVLATLWRYQQQSFGNDTSKRWTFMVFPDSADFPRYLRGLSEAVSSGWVTVERGTNQCMLTNEGIAYIESNSEIENYGDIYRF